MLFYLTNKNVKRTINLVMQVLMVIQVVANKALLVVVDLVTYLVIFLVVATNRLTTVALIYATI